MSVCTIPETSHAEHWNALLPGLKPGSPHDLFGACDDDFWYWLNTTGYAEYPELHHVLPSVPTDEVQLRFTGRTSFENLSEAFSAYCLFKHVIETHLGLLRDCHNILDFGCGWGRIIRFFMKDVCPTKLWGADCLPEAIDHCRTTNKWCNFRTIEPLARLPFDSNVFDCIYCFSVFSHLSEASHLHCLKEFARVLKPGGLLIATTRPKEFITYCAHRRTIPDLPPWLLAFQDTDHWLSSYDEGRFCHVPMGGGGTLDRSFYGETCIPKSYVESHWRDHLTPVDFIVNRDLCEQNVIVARKPPTFRKIMHTTLRTLGLRR